MCSTSLPTSVRLLFHCCLTIILKPGWQPKASIMQKQLLSIIVVILFVGFALASKVNKIHYGAFNYNNNVEEKSEKGNYLLKNDGTKIYGDKIKWKSGLLAKDQIQIDSEKFPLKEIRGYRQGQYFYGRKGNEYIKRIVHGKINIYVEFTEVTTHSTDRDGRVRYSHYTRTDHYAQTGDDGSMVGVAGQNEIKKLVSDCPLAVEMASLSNSKMRKAVKKNRNYLNSIFETYNNGCKMNK